MDDFKLASQSGIFAITQAILSVLVVLGVGFAVFTQAPNTEILYGLGGTVLGYYFSRTATSVSGEVSALRSLRAQRTESQKTK